MAEPRYRIGTVARLSGVSTHLIRIWERRYDALEPDRSGGGARLYSPADLERLRLLKRAVDRGHAIGQVARLGRDELERLAGTAGEPAAADEIEAFTRDFIAAVNEFDGDRAEELLVRASLVFSARALTFDVLGPLLERVGEAWADGRLCVASEHVASALVRDSLGGLLRRLPKHPGAELVVVTTPEGEFHEFGALLASVAAGMQGFRVLHLGPSLPASEIVRAVRGSSATIVALSVVSLAPELAIDAVRELFATLPEDVEIVLGGRVSGVVRDVLGKRVLVLDTLANLDYWLAARREATRSRKTRRI